MSSSCWLIGSIASFGNQTAQINGATSVPMTFSYSGTYLDHATAAISMVKAFTVALLAAGLTGGYCYVGQDGYVHLEASATFTVEWTSNATALRDALGFTGDLSGADSYTAANRSPLLWVPRRDGSPMKAPLGVVGDSTHAVHQFVAPDGVQVTREYGSSVRRNAYIWHLIDQAQYWTPSEADGELFAWVAEVGVSGEKFWLYRETDADYTSTSAVTLGDALGPYEMTDGLAALKLIRSTGFERTDCKFDFTANVLKVAEYTS